jgi:hypothetical protein
MTQENARTKKHVRMPERFDVAFVTISFLTPQGLPAFLGA